MQTKLLASVGKGGKNRREDAVLVQTLLGRQGAPGKATPVAIDGVVGPATIRAISEFQLRVMRMAVPDGRVDPGGQTLRALLASPGGLAPAAIGAKNAARPIPARPTIVYDLESTSALLRSVAMAVGMQQHTTVRWKEYRDSSVLNALYAVLFWKGGPGWAEVQSNADAIAQQTDLLHERYVMSWLEQAASGAGNAARYLESMVKVRASSLDGLRQLQSETAGINSEVVERTNRAISVLAVTKLVSTTAVAATGVGASFTLVGGSALVADAVGVGYSVSCSLIKEWSNGTDAKVLAVGKDLGKFGLQKAGEKSAEAVGEAAAREALRQDKILAKALDRIDRYSGELTRRIGEHRRRLAERNLRGAEKTAIRAAETSLKKESLARGAAVTRKAIPVIFAAWDVIEEAVNTAEIWEQTR